MCPQITIHLVYIPNRQKTTYAVQNQIPALTIIKIIPNFFNVYRYTIWFVFQSALKSTISTQFENFSKCVKLVPNLTHFEKQFNVRYFFKVGCYTVLKGNFFTHTVTSGSDHVYFDGVYHSHVAFKLLWNTVLTYIKLFAPFSKYFKKGRIQFNIGLNNCLKL